MSIEKKHNLTTLRQAMKDATEDEQFLLGRSNEELDAEHEAEFRLYMEEVEIDKRLSLIDFLNELHNPNYEHNLVDEPPTAIASEVYRLYCNWGELDDTPTLNEQTFLHGLYLFGFVSENWHIGIEGITGIGIEESENEIRLNLAPNRNA